MYMLTRRRHAHCNKTTWTSNLVGRTRLWNNVIRYVRNQKIEKPNKLYKSLRASKPNDITWYQKSTNQPD